MPEKEKRSGDDYRITRTVLEAVKMPNGCGMVQKGAICDGLRQAVATHGQVVEVDDNTDEELRILPENEVIQILDQCCSAEE